MRSFFIRNLLGVRVEWGRRDWRNRQI